MAIRERHRGSGRGVLVVAVLGAATIPPCLAHCGTTLDSAPAGEAAREGGLSTRRSGDSAEGGMNEGGDARTIVGAGAATGTAPVTGSAADDAAAHGGRVTDAGLHEAAAQDVADRLETSVGDSGTVIVAAGSLDAADAAFADAARLAEASSAALDAGFALEQVWLGPMNTARAAVGEQPLHWDPIAAEVALAYAQKCNYQHNLAAGAEYIALGGKSGLGEDIAAGAPTQTIDGALSSWIGERADYDHATNSCAPKKACGHYTQIVWSTTTGVGCAKVSCTTNSPFGNFANGKWDFEVCDFSPPGNFVNKAPY